MTDAIISLEGLEKRYGSIRALEGLTAVIVNVNKRYKAHAGIRVSGVR